MTSRDGESADHIEFNSANSEQARDSLSQRTVMTFVHRQKVTKAQSIYVDRDDAAELANYGFEVISGKYA